MARKQLVPAAVWRCRPELVVALDERFGDPLDCYVNGSQVWLRDDGPGGVTLEWRLHPVASFRRPESTGTYELFLAIALALETGACPPAAPESLWDGLEAFPAYGDRVEPLALAAATTGSLGLEPDAVGLVDHGPIADRWEERRGAVSIVADLLRQLGADQD